MTALTLPEYRESLEALVRIEEPTIEQVLAACPYQYEGTEQHSHLANGGSGYLPFPPVLIGDAFQLGYYTPKDWGDRGDPSSFRLDLVAFRQSLGAPANPFNTLIERAVMYGNEHWGDALILGDWQEVLRFYIQDPTDLSVRGHPRTLWEVAVGLSSPGSDAQVHSLDDAISFATADPLEVAEMKSERSHPRYNCSRCGGGLSGICCTGCNVFFREELPRGWSTPLPPKVVQLLRGQGHEFDPDLDPARLY